MDVKRYPDPSRPKRGGWPTNDRSRLLLIIIGAKATRLMPHGTAAETATPQQVYFHLHIDDELVAKHDACHFGPRVCSGWRFDELQRMCRRVSAAWFRLATKPICTGSVVVEKTIGIVAIAALAALAAGVEQATIRAT